jgi:hypothetical protein
MSAPHYFEMKVNSGTSANFHEVSHHLPHQPTSKSNPSVSVVVPNGQIMTSKSTTNLPLPSLPPSATISHGFPNLSSGSLLSVGKICDHRCTAIFTNNSIKMYRNADVHIKETKPPLISGTRNAPSQPLYNVCLPIPPPIPHSIHMLQSESANAAHLPHLQDRIAFYHAALFSPVISTWIKAINAGFLDSWPELTTKQVQQYKPHSEATVMGHMHAQQSNLRSTKTPKPVFNIASKPTSVEHRTHHIYTACETITGQVGSDQTGRFVVPSTSGNNYICVLYDYDSNSIYAEPSLHNELPHLGC